MWRKGAIHYVADISVLRFTQGSLPDPAKAPLANAYHAGVAAVPTAVQRKDEKFLARAELISIHKKAYNVGDHVLAETVLNKIFIERQWIY